MDVQATKIELVKLLLETDEASLLQKVKDVFQTKSYLDNLLSPEQELILNERIVKYEKGEIKFSEWKDLENELND